jgi:hypothetical protein
MLGELIYECKGKIIGARVLPNGNLENTGMMQGYFLGEEFTSTWTGEGDIRPDGTGYTELRGFFTTKGGTIGRFLANGNGIIKPDGSMSFRGSICYNSPPGKFSRLNGIAVVYEYESDKDGNFHQKGWEWK